MRCVVSVSLSVRCQRSGDESRIIRSETMIPFTLSGGSVAHNPKTPIFLPRALTMFQIAGTARSSLVMGSRTRVTGSNRVKSRMRCSSGETPVIIVVHTSGERGGCCVRSTRLLPARVSEARFGIVPPAAY